MEQSSDSGLRVTGKLTIRDITREVVLEAEQLGVGKDPWGNIKAAFEAKTSIDRRDFSLKWNQALETGGLLVGEKIEIALEIHDYFDASLVACKALTATWYAKKHGMALQRVETHVERDDSRERQGTCSLRVKLAFHGELSQEDRQRFHAAVAQCPIHKLMTSATIEVVTEPLEAGANGVTGS